MERQRNFKQSLMFGHGHVMQWARKERKEKYMLCNGQGKKTKKISRDRCTDDAKRAVFARGCQFYESMCIIIVCTDSRNFDNKTQALLQWNPPPKVRTSFHFRNIASILFTSICVILSAGKKYGGEGVRGGGCGVVFSSTSCQGHQAIWSWAKFTLNYRLRKRSRHIPALWPPLLQPWGSRLATSPSHSKSQPGDPPKSESPKI